MKTQNRNTKIKSQNRSIILGFLFLLIFPSCIENQQDQINIDPINSESKRLIFNSFSEFENLISKVNQKDLHSFPQELEEKIKLFPKFSSLDQSFSKNPQVLSSNLRAINLSSDYLLDSISELVPDMSLRLFLNENMEIEVDSKIFKVTPYGTFYTKSENYERMLYVIEEYGKIFNKNGRLSGDGSLSEIDGAGDIYFIDTFGDEQPNQTTSIPVTDNAIYQANDFMAMAPYLYALPKEDYQKFVDYSYGAKTWVGQLIEGIAGGNTDFEQNYNSTYRLRVKLYDFSYGFYRSVGLNSKLQKKGWTGIWALSNDVKAEKLVLGWDGLLLNIKVPYAMPIGYASFPTKGVSQEILNFTNFSLPTGNITDVRVPFLGVQSFSYNDLEKMLKKVLKVSYSKLTKEIWTEAETSFATASYEVKQETVKSYRKVFPDEIKLALSRHEISGNNINELSFVIDRYAGLTYKSTGTGNFSSFSKNVIEPTLSSSKKMYDIDAASVYGASVFLGQLKGIRIIKELND